MEHVAQVNEILHPHRFVQAIFGVQGLHGGLGQVFLTHEGVARQKLLHEKRKRYQHKQRHNAIGHPLYHIFGHAAGSSFPCFNVFFHSLSLTQGARRALGKEHSPHSLPDGPARDPSNTAKRGHRSALRLRMR